MKESIEPSARLQRLLERYRPLVEAEMRTVVGTVPVELFGWMRYHLGWQDIDGRVLDSSSGKLLRPAALLLAAELVGAKAESVVPAAAAVELVHAFSLLHDDVEDESRLRRDRPALWTIAGPAQAVGKSALPTAARLLVLVRCQRLVLAAAVWGIVAAKPLLLPWGLVRLLLLWGLVRHLAIVAAVAAAAAAAVAVGLGAAKPLR